MTMKVIVSAFISLAASQEESVSMMQTATTHVNNGRVQVDNADDVRCAGFLNNAPTEIAGNLINICARGTTVLANVDFQAGTYKITQPGVYRLGSDIIMEPSGDNIAHMMPTKGNPNYKFEDGFWLGFFGAISVQSDDVFIDLNGYSLSMSPEFNARQRFFQLIQLGSKPFSANVGPPQFNILDKALFSPKNVIIADGTLGLSSHIGIHGNDVENIWVHKLTIENFEVGGIQMNGAKNFHVTNATIGPSSSQVPALATLSQAQNILRIVEAEEISGSEFTNLRSAVEQKVASQPSDTTVFDAPVETDGSVFPDGSALYGIVFHKLGPSVHEFMTCSDNEQYSADFGPVYLDDVKIKSLRLRADEVVGVAVSGARQLGPAGDVFQLFRASHPTSGHYVGNPLSEAQFAMAESKASFTGTADEIFANYGSTSIHEKFLEWRTAGTRDWRRGQAFRQNLSFRCDKDAMGHHNKGVVGIRLNGIEKAVLRNVDIEDLQNFGNRANIISGLRNFGHCPEGIIYHGNDVRGITGIVSPNISVTNVKVSNLHAHNGVSVGVEARSAVRISGSIEVKDLYSGAAMPMRND